MHTSREKSLPRQGGAGEAGAGVEEPVPEGGRGGRGHTGTEPVVADRGPRHLPPTHTTAKKGREEARKAREGQTPEGESPIVENNRESEMLRRDSKPDEANRLHRGCKKNKERGGGVKSRNAERDKRVITP